MMFFFHVLALAYGLLGLLVGKLRTSAYFDAAPSWVLEKVDSFFPESVYKPFKDGETELIPDLSRTYVISGGIAAYALYYLKSRHRS